MSTYTARIWWQCPICGRSGDSTTVDLDPDQTIGELAGWHNCRSAS